MTLPPSPGRSMDKRGDKRCTNLAQKEKKIVSLSPRRIFSFFACARSLKNEGIRLSGVHFLRGRGSSDFSFPFFSWENCVPKGKIGCKTASAVNVTNGFSVQECKVKLHCAEFAVAHNCQD